jgi:hypothetical protein
MYMIWRVYTAEYRGMQGETVFRGKFIVFWGKLGLFYFNILLLYTRLWRCKYSLFICLKYSIFKFLC